MQIKQGKHSILPTAGQSTVEYIVLVTAVVLVMIIFLVSGKSPFQSRLTGTLDQAAKGMGEVSTRLSESP